jgi:CHAD domain-containing protein
MVCDGRETALVSHLEIEKKYDATEHFELPDLSGLPGIAAVTPPSTEILVAKYFDTDDLSLAARGITLRRRRGGEDAGWHLKIPVGPNAKNEVQAPLGETEKVPARLARVVAASTRGAALRPVAVLETRRTVVKLLTDDGRVLAEVADDDVSGQVLNGDSAAQRWREIEVELGDAGSTKLLKAVGRRLRDAGAQPAETASKLARVLPARPARDSPRTAPETAGDVVLAYLRAQFDALLSFDPKARLAEPDAVHRMRVAVRRIRSLLKSYRKSLDRERIAPLRAELKWLAGVLGEVRDLEVLRERFTAMLAELPAEIVRPEGWLAGLAAQERAAYRRLNTALSGDRYLALLTAMESLIADPPLTERAARPAAEEVPHVIRRTWQKLARSYEAAESAPDPDLARHEARKDAKRVRYAAEAGAAALGDPAVNVARQAERLQEFLGGYQDGVLAQRYLAAAAERAAPEEVFALGTLAGIEHCTGAAARTALPGVWAEVSDPAHLAALS